MEVFVNAVILISLTFSMCYCYNWGYTEEAYTLDGEPCMSNCVMRMCVVNWRMKEKSCNPTGMPALIYFTSEKKRPYNKRCLSNCGRFSYSYNWCITTEEGHWDYCNPDRQESEDSRDRLYPRVYSVRSKYCVGEKPYCRKDWGTYYKWCTIDNSNNWDYCAPAAVPRIPILPRDFRSGLRNNKDCFRVINFRNVSHTPDGFLQQSIEVLQEDFTSIKRLIYDPANFVPSYEITLVDLPRRLSVPIAIEMTIEKQNVRGKVDFAEMIRRHLMEMEAPQNVDMGSVNLLDNYDIKASTPVLETPEWLKMTNMINTWVKDNYKVELLIVFYYSDYTNPVIAFGVSATKWRNQKYLSEVCQGVLFFNGHMPSAYAD